MDRVVETFVLGASSIWLGLLSCVCAALCGWMVSEGRDNGERLLLTGLTMIGSLLSWFLAFHFAVWPLTHVPI